MNFNLTSNDPLTQRIMHRGIMDWHSLTIYVQSLPYGRNKSRSDFTLVWDEQKGTCSSKHAFLKHIANLNDRKDVKLILAIFRMDSVNTIGVGKVLEKYKLNYIPEAHCFVSLEGQDFDFTTMHSDINKIFPAIIYKEEIEPQSVATYKVEFHKKFIQNWINENQIPYSFKQVWDLRETCIENLSSLEC